MRVNYLQSKNKKLGRSRRKIFIILFFLFTCILFYALLFDNNNNKNAVDRILISLALSANAYIDNHLRRGPNYSCNLTSKNLFNNLQKRQIVILYWTNFFNYPHFGVGFCNEPFRQCPSNCVTTNDRRLLDVADAVVFHGWDLSYSDLPTKVLEHQKWIFFLLESPATLFLDLRRFNNLFDLTMTYRRDSDVVLPYGKVIKLPESKKIKHKTNRTKSIAWVVSHCSPNSKRQSYAKELKQYVQVDIYGECGKKCVDEQSGKDFCSRKVLALDYKFYLAFENSVCRDYITEKFFDALRNGLVPIVLGPDKADYEKVAPPYSFIHVNNFPNVKKLASYISYLIKNETAYEEYLAWRIDFEVIDNIDKSKESWCNLCHVVHNKANETTVYSDIHSWWNDDTSCINFEPYNILFLVIKLLLIILCLTLIITCIFFKQKQFKKNWVTRR